jgi:hypothetical protein
MEIPNYNSAGRLFPNSNFSVDTAYKSHNLSDAKKCGNSVWLNTVRQINNSKTSLLNKGYCFIQDIFRKYWEPFYNEHKDLLKREAIIENVERFIKCGDITEGFLYYECEKGCGVHISGFTCKSRFCPKCGKKYRDRRTKQVAEKLIECPHRQFVFTIPKEYRNYYQKYRGLLNVLFATANQTFNNLLGNSKGIAKKEKRKLGFVSFLHTYGRDMKWNPHLHILIAEQMLINNNELKKFDYFHFDLIRKTYMFNLLNNTYKYLREYKISKKELTNLYFLNKTLKETYNKGFYVHGPHLRNSSISSVKAIAKYIARYASHPAISERRIIKIDYQADMITWFYDPHEDDDIKDEELKQGRQIITEPVFDFIKRLIIHIPNKGFQQIRYYGFYSNKSTFKKDTSLFTKKQLKAMENDTLWIRGLLNTFGYTPLLCSVCGNRLHLNLNKSLLSKGGFT